MSSFRFCFFPMVSCSCLPSRPCILVLYHASFNASGLVIRAEKIIAHLTFTEKKLSHAFLHYSFILCKYFRVQCIKEKDAATCLPSSCRTWVCTQMKALIHMEGKHCFVCRFLGFICQFEPEEMQQGSSQFEPDPKQIGVPIIMARN